MHHYLNKKLYSGILFKAWTEKRDLIPIEAYFIKKYLIDTTLKVIEAGTGGGRIIFAIEKIGFKKLYAFDYVENMIAFCNERKKQLNSSVNFTTTDALNLENYKDRDFDYLVYMQQVLCFVGREQIELGLNEAHRVGKENAVYIFSFLNWKSKWYNPLLSILVNFFRILRNDKTSKYELPWLYLDGKFNWKFLNKSQPQNLWFKEDHVISLLENCGFYILELKNRVNTTDKVTHLHIACKKSN